MDINQVRLYTWPKATLSYSSIFKVSAESSKCHGVHFPPLSTSFLVLISTLDILVCLVSDVAVTWDCSITPALPLLLIHHYYSHQQFVSLYLKVPNDLDLGTSIPYTLDGSLLSLVVVLMLTTPRPLSFHFSSLSVLDLGWHPPCLWGTI